MASHKSVITDSAGKERLLGVPWWNIVSSKLSSVEDGGGGIAGPVFDEIGRNSAVLLRLSQG